MVITYSQNLLNLIPANKIIKSKEELHNRNLWLVFFIYISIFINSYVFFKKPFEFYVGYLIYVILLPVFVSRYGVNRHLFFIFLILLVSGIVNIFLDQNTFALFLKVFTGLTLSYFFYHYVILEFNYDVEKLFKWYLKGAYYCAVIGIFQFISFQIKFTPGYNFRWIFNKWGLVLGGNFGIRVNSVFGEPTYLAATLSAAFFVALYSLFRKQTYYLNRYQCLIIVAAYILSFSGLGQTGILLTLVLLAVSFGLVRYILVFIPISLFVFNIMYNNSRDFRERYDSLIGLFSGAKFELGKTHGSSFILYNNYVVATKNFQSNFLFGSGIGSHPVAFEKHSLANTFTARGFNSNSADANSMFLRLVSETGIFGVLIFLYIIFKYYIRRDPNIDTFHWLVSNAILVMIILNLFRQGHYFLNGFPFFVLLYIYNSVNYKQFLQGQIVEKS